MRRRLRIGLSLVASAAVLVCAAGAQAIIMRHDRPDSRYRDLGETYRPFVVQLGLPGADGVRRLYGGMGTLVAPTWVLTAGHTADRFAPGSAYPIDLTSHEVWVMGRAYRLRSVHLHPDYVRGEADHDIALLELESAPSDARIACLYAGSDEQDQQVINVGAGTPGDGLSGVGTPDGALRGATTLVDRVEDNVLIWRFRAPDDPRATDLHGISGPGDSGGPALIIQGNEICVAGVSDSQRRRSWRAPGTYGVDEVYARVSSHRDWIISLIGSEPSA